MRKHALSIGFAALGWAIGSAAHGHGTPITVNVADDALTVSHSDDDYARFVFGQHEEESDPQGPLTLPDLGSSLLWDLPGLDLYGVDESASLALEVLAPIGPDGAPLTLWYWNASKLEVERAPAARELRLLLADGSAPALSGADASAPAPIVLAETLTGQTGYHNHGLLNFAMPYDGTFDAGLYGFFARLGSDSYASSEAMLIVFNLGASHDDLAAASDAIWGAATPGDYNRDGAVDSADLATWRSAYEAAPEFAHLGADGNGDGVVNAADYAVWRDHAAAAPLAIPEPVGALLTLGTLLLLRRSRGRRSAFAPRETAQPTP